MKTFEQFLQEKCPCHTNNSEDGFERWLEDLDQEQLIYYGYRYGLECNLLGFKEAMSKALGAFNDVIDQKK